MSITKILAWLKSLFARSPAPVQPALPPLSFPPIKVLFILKRREITDPTTGQVYSHAGMSSGLTNSARMVMTAINAYGLNNVPCQAEMVQVIDNNDIDREVTRFQPDVVIIEAIWVVPEKFPILVKLHPTVKWIIRNHSNVPFLAQEGQTFDWLARYVETKNVYVASNTMESVNDIKDIVWARQDIDRKALAEKVLFFPNYYWSVDKPLWQPKNGLELHVSCFGAIRPLKNHLVQAIAAIRYARASGQHLYFHINSGRIESGGAPVAKNLFALFQNESNATLVNHEWMSHADFIKLVASMDVSLQVSFSETFNIVTADAVRQNVPIVVSPDVKWCDSKYYADPTSADDIVEKMTLALTTSDHIEKNNKGLNDYNERSLHHITVAILSTIGEDLLGQV
jgi:hypothetical protein